MSIMIENPAVKRRTLLAGLASLSALLLMPPAAHALSERIVHNPVTGIAIGGYDCVAYFLDGMAREGEPEFEVAWAGGFFRFINEGNAAAFQEAPDAYAPLFGGYTPTGVARGIAQVGDPRQFVIYERRLMFFYDRHDRNAFLETPATILTKAEALWPQVRGQLAE